MTSYDQSNTTPESRQVNKSQETQYRVKIAEPNGFTYLRAIEVRGDYAIIPVLQDDDTVLLHYYTVTHRETGRAAAYYIPDIRVARYICRLLNTQFDGNIFTQLVEGGRTFELLNKDVVASAKETLYRLRDKWENALDWCIVSPPLKSIPMWQWNQGGE